MFARAIDGAIHYTIQSGPRANWSDWQWLGGGVASSPAIAINTSETREVFAT